jgi:hypothetical protein
MLSSASDQYREQQRIAAAAKRELSNKARRGYRWAAIGLAYYQTQAMEQALAALLELLAEQGIPSNPVGAPSVQSLISTTTAVVDRMEKTDTAAEFDRLVATMVADAAREAEAVAFAAEPAVTTYVRFVSPPCCGRCAVLAGRVYRWSTGFQRHPQCDCQMVPSNRANARDLTFDPDELFRSGGIRGLSRADTQALNLGADLGQIVNVRTKKAGLTRGTSVLARRGRPTPAGILAGNPSKAEAVAQLRANGYLI